MFNNQNLAVLHNNIACFPVTGIEEKGSKFLLGSSKLSEQFWNLKYKPILERFSVTHYYQVKNFTNQKIVTYL
jgi:hypothetical protein